MEKVERMGGMIRAIEAGFVQQQIQNAAFGYQKRVEEKQQIVVGVNEFQVKESPARIHRLDPKLEARQIARLKKFRNGRDAKKAERSLAALEVEAKGSENLIPFIYEAVRARATLGEISDRLRKIFGVYKENVVV